MSAMTQRRSAIPTRTRSRHATAQSIAEATPLEDAVRGLNHAGPSLTTFRDMQGAGVSGGLFLNTTGPVYQSVYNGGATSMQPLEDHGNIVGNGSNIFSTHNHRDGPTIATSEPSQNAAYDIYYRHLLAEGRGTPLWEPGPDMMLPTEYRKQGVSIGDVGILYRTGDFAFLFNIFLPADHEINEGRVPHGFIPLEKSKVEKAIKKSIVYDRGSCLASPSVRRTDSTSEFAFQTTGSEGAVLIMPDGALSEDVRKYKVVNRYIAENAKGWYEYVESDNCGVQTENGDIRVVVGIDKVSSWGMATFKSINADEPLRFEFNDNGRAPQTYRWDGIVAGRTGPAEEEIRDLRGPNTSPLRNQSVFVRTLNISVSGKVQDELAVYEIRASRFRDGIPDSSWHRAQSRQQNVNIQTPQIGLPVSDPSKLLNKYLLEKCPKAEVAITKDSDWMSVITKNDSTNPSFEEICARVLASHVICETDGVVTLEKRENGFGTVLSSDLSSIAITPHQWATSEDVLPTDNQILKAQDNQSLSRPPGIPSNTTVEKLPKGPDASDPMDTGQVALCSGQHEPTAQLAVLNNSRCSPRAKIPHSKRTIIKHYRISEDILILILENLNPISLYRACQAFERIYKVVMRFQPLRYMFELAAIGMQDGPVSYATCPPAIRLRLVLAYKTDWPRLKWIVEERVKAPAVASQIGVSGNFLYYVTNDALCLFELPSFRRTGQLIPQRLHITYNTTPNADCVAIDPNLHLIITGHFTPQNGCLLLKIRDLYTFEKHPDARSAYYESLTHIAQPVYEIFVSVCDSKLICTLHFGFGLSKHLLLDWISLKSMWLEEQDVVFLNSSTLLSAKRCESKVTLCLSNISNMDRVSTEREYELPPHWNNSTMRFVRNNVSNTKCTTPSNALFCSDPSARVLVLSAKPGSPQPTSVHWMVINESFFRPTTHEDKYTVPWPYWSQFCLIKELQLSLLAGTPQVAGSRILYLGKDGTRSSVTGQYRTKLKLIDFSPYCDMSSPSPKDWSLLGQSAIIKPTEYQHDFSATTTNGLAVEGIHATEDNIVFLLEKQNDIKPVVISTFGPPSQ